HYEQVAERARVAVNNAVKVFNNANEAAQSLRKNQDSSNDFSLNTLDQERDYNSRLIEVFGYPYPQDTNPESGDVYGINYDGPDLYHSAYVDVRELLGVDLPETESFSYTFRTPIIGASGEISYEDTQPVEFKLARGFGFVKPVEFTQDRKAPGEVQLAR